MCSHGHGDEPQALPLGAGGETVAGGGGKPGFQACGPGVKPNQLIGIGKAEGPVPHGVHPDGGVFLNVRVLAQQLPGHKGNVVGAGFVAFGIGAVVQPCAVDKVSVLHAQFLGPGVHPVHEGAFTAGEVLGHGAGAVVGGGHGDGFEHFADGHLLPGFQINLAAPLGRRGLGGGDNIVVVDAPGVDGLHNQQHGHHLGDAGGGQGLVGVLFIEHCAGGYVH